MDTKKTDRILKYYERINTHESGVERIQITNGTKRYTGQFYNCEDDDLGDVMITVTGEEDSFYRLEDVEDPYSGNNY